MTVANIQLRIVEMKKKAKVRIWRDGNRGMGIEGWEWGKANEKEKTELSEQLIRLLS